MKLTRLSCNLNQETAYTLKRLSVDDDLSMTEVIRRAIALYKYITDEIDNGRMVMTMDSDEQNRRELILFR